MGLCAISGWMAVASYAVYFSAPIQAITTTSPYRTSSRPAVASGCSAVTAEAGRDWVNWSMDNSFPARDMAGQGPIRAGAASAPRRLAGHRQRMRRDWLDVPRDRSLTFHPLFVARQVPAWPRAAACLLRIG